MIVLYLKENNQFLQAIMGFPEVEELDGKLYMDDDVIVNDLIKIGYALYPDQEINLKYEEDEQLGLIEIPQTLEELNLVPMSADALPKSEHIGKLKAVNIGQAKLATVTRRFWGEDYDVSCLATQSIKDLYQAGDIQIGDFVLVSFIEETPNGAERNIAIVTDKVYQSW